MGRNYFNYVKNQPTTETFNNYEYALVRIFKDSLGNNPELNGVFIKERTLYFDIKSTSSYFMEMPYITMSTTQTYFLCLLRYPSGLNINNYSIWCSSFYEA